MPRPSKTSNDLQSIHPTLKAALGSLDVQLEEELSRYRKQRRTVPVMAASRIGQASLAPPLEVVNLHLPSSPIPASALPQGAENESKSFSDSEDTTNPKLNSPSTPQLRAATGVKIGDDESKINSLATSDTQTPPTPPDDYLESSEQLLKSLTEEPQKPRGESLEEESASLADNLLTPLGMGSMLLLLLSSASIGYLLFNPALVQRLGLNRFFPVAAPVAVSPNPTATNSPSIAPPAISPNLANGGLENLDRNSISNLKPSENSTRSPIPSVPSLPKPSAVTTPGKTNPAIISGSPDLAGQLGIPPVAAPLATPPSPAAPPKPSPSPAAARPNPAPSSVTSPTTTNPRRDTYFYVVAAYDGDRSLAQARAVIPEAYIAEIPNQGTQIQMGAFLVEAEAKALIQELKQKGITATVYQPN